MSDRILVPVDGSPLSRRALEVACEEYPDADILALHVVDPTEPGYSVFGVEDDPSTDPPHASSQWRERAEDLGSGLLEELREEASDQGVEIETGLTYGRPDREILEYADREGVDHIIAGSHGRSEDTRLLLGSVTEAIAFRAPVRVTLVR